MNLMKKLKLILVNFIIIYFIIINPIKAQETISGKVRVIDGDTIVINGFFQKAGTPGKKLESKDKTFWYRCTRNETNLQR